MSTWLSRHKVIKRIASVTALFAFITSVVLSDAWAAVDKAGVPHERMSSYSPASSALLDPETFTIPAYLGEIKDKWQAPSNHLLSAIHHSQSTVIHIQDAHCNYAAQHKIADILEYLNREYGIDTVNLEGGSEDYDLSIFTVIRDKDLRREVGDYFVEEGLVSGAEYFAMNNPDEVVLWGVEDIRLYLENLDAYRDFLGHKEKADKHIKALGHILNNLKRHIYSKELLELDIKRGQYDADNRDFKDYLAWLVGKAEEKAIDITSLVNVGLFNKSLAAEGKVDFKKAARERTVLVDELRRMLSKKELEKLVLKTVEFKKEMISRHDYHSYLIKKALMLNLDMGRFPELQKYKIYVSMYETIDKSAITKEIAVLEDKIKASLYQNDKQRELALLSKNFALMKGIFDISLTKDEYNYYTANRNAFAIRNYLTFIEREAPLHKITARPAKDIEDLDLYREKLEKFYEYSFKRDNAFLKNIIFPRAPSTIHHPLSTVLITGGFHTENLCELFKKHNISYVSITPNFKNQEGYECPYFELLSGGRNMIPASLISQVSALALYSDFCKHAGQIYGEDSVKAKELWVKLVRAVLEGRESMDAGSRRYSFVEFDGSERVEGVIIKGKQLYAGNIGSISAENETVAGEKSEAYGSSGNKSKPHSHKSPIIKRPLIFLLVLLLSFKMLFFPGLAFNGRQLGEKYIARADVITNVDLDSEYAGQEIDLAALEEGARNGSIDDADALINLAEEGNADAFWLVWDISLSSSGCEDKCKYHCINAVWRLDPVKFIEEFNARGSGAAFDVLCLLWRMCNPAVGEAFNRGEIKLDNCIEKAEEGNAGAGYALWVLSKVFRYPPAQEALEEREIDLDPDTVIEKFLERRNGNVPKFLARELVLSGNVAALKRLTGLAEEGNELAIDLLLDIEDLCSQKVLDLRTAHLDDGLSGEALRRELAECSYNNSPSCLYIAFISRENFGELAAMIFEELVKAAGERDLNAFLKEVDPNRTFYKDFLLQLANFSLLDDMVSTPEALRDVMDHLFKGLSRETIKDNSARIALFVEKIIRDESFAYQETFQTYLMKLYGQTEGYNHALVAAILAVYGDLLDYVSKDDIEIVKSNISIPENTPVYYDKLLDEDGKLRVDIVFADGDAADGHHEPTVNFFQDKGYEIDSSRSTPEKTVLVDVKGNIVLSLIKAPYTGDYDIDEHENHAGLVISRSHQGNEDEVFKDQPKPSRDWEGKIFLVSACRSATEIAHLSQLYPGAYFIGVDATAYGWKTNIVSYYLFEALDKGFSTFEEIRDYVNKHAEEAAQDYVMPGDRSLKVMEIINELIPEEDQTAQASTGLASGQNGAAASIFVPIIGGLAGKQRRRGAREGESIDKDKEEKIRQKVAQRLGVDAAKIEIVDFRDDSKPLYIYYPDPVEMTKDDEDKAVEEIKREAAEILGIAAESASGSIILVRVAEGLDDKIGEFLKQAGEWASSDEVIEYLAEKGLLDKGQLLGIRAEVAKRLEINPDKIFFVDTPDARPLFKFKDPATGRVAYAPGHCDREGRIFLSIRFISEAAGMEGITPEEAAIALAEHEMRHATDKDYRPDSKIMEWITHLIAAEAEVTAETPGEGEVSSSKAGNERAAAVITKTIKARQAAVLDHGYLRVNRRRDHVIAVVGVPGELLQELWKMGKDAGKALAEAGFGELNARQIMTFDINDPDSYWKAMEKAMEMLDELQAGLDSLIKNGKRESEEAKKLRESIKNARIVSFAPQKREERLKLAEKARDKYAEAAHITVVADAYTDCSVENGQVTALPDIYARGALARLIAFYYNTGQDYKPEAFGSIKSFLGRISSNEIESKNLESLLKSLFKEALKIGSVFEDLEQMQRSYEAIETAL